MSKSLLAVLLADDGRIQTVRLLGGGELTLSGRGRAWDSQVGDTVEVVKRDYRGASVWMGVPLSAGESPTEQVVRSFPVDAGADGYDLVRPEGRL